MSTYIAKVPDARGIIDYTEEENGTWQILYERQKKIIQNRACEAFIRAVDILAMPADRIPQLPEMNAILQRETGWSVEAVPALIDITTFFTLLANKRFPAATFIRRRAELDYLQEPDLFHEFFGHCPLITNPVYADFMQWYGQYSLKANSEQQRLLARLFWFTIEFGLIASAEGVRVYGGGILSSKGETVYAVESDVPERRPFDIDLVLRTPYRIDIMQPIYYVIQSFEDLYHLRDGDLLASVDAALVNGDDAPAFMTC